MTRGTVLAWLLTLLTGGGAIALAGNRELHARQCAGDVINRHRVCVAAAEKIVELRSRLPAWATRPRPALDKGGLAACLASAMSLSGVPTSALTSLSPQVASTSGVRQGGPRYVRERAGLVLEPVSLPQLGRFLANWREKAPEWPVVSVDLALLETSRRADPRKSSGEPQLRVVLAIECAYAQEQGGGD